VDPGSLYDENGQCLQRHEDSSQLNLEQPSPLKWDVPKSLAQSVNKAVMEIKEVLRAV